jgi:aryl-alcohol dehydrogenase-like predicted oxidoreductase
MGGAYTNPERSLHPAYTGPDTDCRLEMLKTIASETGATLNQVVIAWMLHSDYPVIPLIAASDEDQLKENLGALDVHLIGAQMTRLDSASV